MRASCVLLAVGIAAMARCGVTVTIDKPNYWSGTNCRIMCDAQVNGSTLGITKARIKVGGQQIWYNEYGSGGPRPIYVPHIWPKLMFDSTYWPYNTYLLVEFEVQTTDSATTWTGDSVQRWIKNTAGAWCNEQFGFYGGSQITSAFQAMNYGTYSHHNAWTFAFYFGYIGNTTALDLEVHGNAGAHSNGVSELSSGYEQKDWNAYVDLLDPSSQPLESRIGTGLPPFNSTSAPPINWVHLNACHCGDATEWQRLLYPEKNFYSANQIEDQALLTYKVYTLSDQSDEQAHALMEQFKAGRTVSQAAAQLIAEHIQVKDVLGGTPRDITFFDYTILGDSKTRLHSVYTGDNQAPIGVYRILSNGV